jgi:hypothetical protein
MRGCINGCRSPTMPLPSPQEPTGERKGLSTGTPPPRNAVEAATAVSSAAAGGTREAGPQRSERRAGERFGAARAGRSLNLHIAPSEVGNQP